MIDKVSSLEALTILKKMKSIYFNTNTSWINFYGVIYKFKGLKTDLGYNDLRLIDGTIIKKSKLVKQLFGISESLYSRISALCERFMDIKEDEVSLMEDFKEYDRTKLIELLQLTAEDLSCAIKEGYITPELSRKDLRIVIRRINGDYAEESKPTPEEEEEISYVRTFREHWTKKDLQILAKQELISLYIDLQRKYESIKSKKIAPAQK